MKTIGVRDLRQRASEYLREVEEGRSLEVTAHGRPVAQLVPARPDSRRRALATRGRLTPGVGDVLDLGAPLRPANTTSSATARLERARNHER